MSNIESTLKALASGAFVCSVHYAPEFEVLQSAQGRQQASDWLNAIGYRLARLSDDGAFFMAHGVATVEMRNQVRDDLKNVRSSLEPIIGFLETLRRLQGRNAQLHPGDVVWLGELGEVVRGSALLDRRLQDMRELFDGRANANTSSVQRLQRMFNLLVQDGYLVQTNSVSKGYTFTGKVEYLYQLIAFIAENALDMSEVDVVDQIDGQVRIDGEVAAQDELIAVQ